MSIVTLIRSAFQDRKGIASLEYALLAVGILTGLALAVNGLGAKIQSVYTTTLVNLL
jgi:Flp pilus assembly pilin Flp